MSDEKKIICDTIELLEGRSRGRALNIKVSEAQLHAVPKWKTILSEYKGDSPVYLHMNGSIIKVGDEHFISIDPAVVQKFEDILGEGAAWVDGTV